MRRGPTPLDAGARSLLRYERMRALASLNGSGFDPLEAVGLQASNVGNGDYVDVRPHCPHARCAA